MTALIMIAKALCLILMATALFLGFDLALQTNAIVSAPQGLCAGKPVASCFLTII